MRTLSACINTFLICVLGQTHEILFSGFLCRQVQNVGRKQIYSPNSVPLGTQYERKDNKNVPHCVPTASCSLWWNDFLPTFCT
jgi:hypothetical protein